MTKSMPLFSVIQVTTASVTFSLASSVQMSRSVLRGLFSTSESEREVGRVKESTLLLEPECMVGRGPT